MPNAGNSPARPALIWLRPMCISPFRNVPVVTITERPAMNTPMLSITPVTRPPSCVMSTILACRIVRPACASIDWRILVRYRARSACARSDQTAGPLERLSILKWMPERSVTRAISPPSASISRTRWPFASPPMAGLQDIWPIVSRFIVQRHVRIPILAAARAASQPAWPAPITITSNDIPYNNIRAISVAFFKVARNTRDTASGLQKSVLNVRHSTPRTFSLPFLV